MAAQNRIPTELLSTRLLSLKTTQLITLQNTLTVLNWIPMDSELHFLQILILIFYRKAPQITQNLNILQHVAE